MLQARQIDILDEIKNHTKLLPRDEWLEAKKTVFTGTDVSTLMGVNKYETPYRLYMRKNEGYQRKENFSMRRGKYLEPLIAECFAEDHPECNIIDLKQGDLEAFTIHPSLPILGGTFDRLVFDGEGNLGVLEIKTSVGYGVEAWAEGIPEPYIIQLQHYMMLVQDILNASYPNDANKVYGVMAYSLDDNLQYSDRIYPNKEIRHQIIDAVVKYNKIVNIDKSIPALEDFEDIRLRYQKERSHEIKEVDKDAVELIAAYLSLKDSKGVSYETYVSEVEKEMKDVQGRIMCLIGDHRGISYDGTIIATRKEDKRGVRRLHIPKKNFYLVIGELENEYNE